MIFSEILNLTRNEENQAISTLVYLNNNVLLESSVDFVYSNNEAVS